jgi:hypothetical protein
MSLRLGALDAEVIKADFERGVNVELFLRCGPDASTRHERGLLIWIVPSGTISIFSVELTLIYRAV